MPGLTVKEIEGAFVCTVVDLGDAGWDPEYGWGMIQIKASLELLKAGLLQTPWFPTPSLTLISEGQGKIKAIWQPADDCNGIQNYPLYMNSDLVNTYSSSQSEGFVNVSESGTYSISLKAVNIFNNSTELITSSITVDLTEPIFENINISVDDNEGIFIKWNNATDLNVFKIMKTRLIDSKNNVVKKSFLQIIQKLFLMVNLNWRLLN